jgi:hypothetical protein
MSLAIVDAANPRAVHDATNASTHSAWNHCGSRVATIGATSPEITRNRSSPTARLPRT